MAAKMKSVSTSGMRVGSPRPSPVPVSPPHASANVLCTIWKPLPSRVGPRVEPDVDAVLHVGELTFQATNDAGREQHGAEREVGRALGGDPQHHDEQREEQQRRAEVLLADHDDERAPQAMSSGPRCSGSGRWNGPTCHVPAASSSRFSTR